VIVPAVEIMQSVPITTRSDYVVLRSILSREAAASLPALRVS